MWTSDLVEARLREAASALKRQKSPDGAFLSAGKISSMPEPKGDVRTGYGYTAVSSPPPKPSMGEISRCNECQGWSRYFSAEQRPSQMPPDTFRVLWARAGHLSWGKIGAERKRRFARNATRGGGQSSIPGGNSSKSLLKIYRDGLDHLARRLNGDAVEVRSADTIID